MEITSVTPEMDRESIKRMGHSLIAFSRLRSLLKMSKKQLADMPKEVMIGCAAHEIALVWDKLPEHLQNDIDILRYQYCQEHYSNDGEDGSCSNVDVNDGPPPRRLFCCYCKVRDVNVAANNEIRVTSPFSSAKRRLTFDHCCKSQ